MVKVFARDGVISEQETTTDCAILDLNDRNFIGRDHFDTIQSSHKSPPFEWDQ
jgi:hypothetical protein